MLSYNTFVIALFWVIALGKSQNLNLTTSKHQISTEDFNELSFIEDSHYPSVAYSSRVKRQLNSGNYSSLIWKKNQMI